MRIIKGKPRNLQGRTRKSLLKTHMVTFRTTSYDSALEEYVRERRKGWDAVLLPTKTGYAIWMPK